MAATPAANADDAKSAYTGVNPVLIAVSDGSNHTERVVAGASISSAAH
jgi:hypothetical protein